MIRDTEAKQQLTKKQRQLLTKVLKSDAKKLTVRQKAVRERIAKKAARLEKETKAFTLSKAGLTEAEIAEVEGTSRANINKRLRSFIKRFQLHDLVEELREVRGKLYEATELGLLKLVAEKAVGGEDVTLAQAAQALKHVSDIRKKGDGQKKSDAIRFTGTINLGLIKLDSTLTDDDVRKAIDITQDVITKQVTDNTDQF